MDKWLAGECARMRGILGSVPFIVKIIVCVMIDFFGLGFGIAQIALLLSGVATAIGLGSIGLSIAYAIFQAIICVLFWNVWALGIGIAFVKSVPGINAIPFLTIICLWHGYKTGWRY
jgi:hydrogenase/urease accessory protein HupE